MVEEHLTEYGVDSFVTQMALAQATVVTECKPRVTHTGAEPQYRLARALIREKRDFGRVNPFLKGSFLKQISDGRELVIRSNGYVTRASLEPVLFDEGIAAKLPVNPIRRDEDPTISFMPRGRDE